MANQTQILNVSDEMKFDDNVQTDNVKEQEENMYSSSSDTTEELYSSSAPDTRGVRSIDINGRREISAKARYHYSFWAIVQGERFSVTYLKADRVKKCDN